MDDVNDEIDGVAEEAEEEAVADAPEDEDLQEHLRDSVAGSMKVKRLLDEAVVEASTNKKQRTADDTKHEARIVAVCARWGCQNDPACRYTLRQASESEFEEIFTSNWKPNPSDTYWNMCEQIFNQTLKIRERDSCGGGALDSVSAFCFRWQLDKATDAQLRSLCHKDLRYVISSFDGNGTVEELAKEAADTEAEKGTTAGTVPDVSGPLALGRFLRLELIDPLADALICGDANLTFSLKLAQHRKGLGHCGRVVSTTFEPLDTLKQRYTEIGQTIQLLNDHYAEVWHCVDATRLAVDDRFRGHEDSFGAVYYNFPHAGAVSGFFDSHPLVNWRHENLMRLFFRALRTFVKLGGSVKVASNAGAVGVRYSYIIQSAVENEFVHVETVPFKEWSLHRYLRSYGDKRDAYKRLTEGGTGYNAQKGDSDMVYSFCYAPTGSDLPEQQIRIPPSKKELMEVQEGPLKGATNTPARMKLVGDLYSRFISEVSGVHVG